LLPFWYIPEDSLQIPLYTVEFEKWKASFAGSLKERFAVTFFHSMVKFLNFISPPLFYHLKKRGVLVIYWVLNDPHDFQRALDVQFIIYCLARRQWNNDR